MSNHRGFTLIELLVVVAIIGLLASIVIASLNSARMKGRDARRVADIRTLQHALEMCMDAATGACASGYPSSTQPTVATSSLGTWLQALPKDPSNSSRSYAYIPLGPTAGPSCTGYHMGAVMEGTGGALNSAAKVAPSATVCNVTNGVWGSGTTNNTTDFGNGTSGSAGCTTTAGTNTCYDVKM